MTAKARRTDPQSSHRAAQQLNLEGVLGSHRLEALRLVKTYPGNSYRFLFDRHLAEASRPGGRQIFQDAAALMRRLGEVAEKDGEIDCDLCGGRRVARWVARH